MKDLKVNKFYLVSSYENDMGQDEWETHVLIYEGIVEMHGGTYTSWRFPKNDKANYFLHITCHNDENSVKVVEI